MYTRTIASCDTSKLAFFSNTSTATSISFGDLPLIEHSIK
jgi:hypothetical protein